MLLFISLESALDHCFVSSMFSHVVHMQHLSILLTTFILNGQNNLEKCQHVSYSPRCMCKANSLALLGSLFCPTEAQKSKRGHGFDPQGKQELKKKNVYLECNVSCFG